ncbi:TniQ family protein [Streptomyces sp. NPDC092369]|uniref:TniQ family protein n=1 Tax=Streptomyces sp. NPDC092369 TaxID=3366015 RepID=UPI003812112F
MDSARPLARSLIALPQEGIDGYVLRLSHRLGQSPGRILWRTGLGLKGRLQSSRARKRLLFALEPDQQCRFAAATRLGIETVDRLTLHSCFTASASVTDDLVNPAQLLGRGRLSSWLLVSRSRYCPLCLAGDGSEVQRRHGGPWKLQWHLPIVFACLDHQVFLQHYCPGCERPDVSPVRLDSAFITSPTVAGLHPAQCRNKISKDPRSPLCGHRLDSLRPPDLALTPALEKLQQELLGLLDGRTGSDPSLRSLAHLRVMAAIVCAAWPHSLRGSGLPTPLTDALSEAVQRPPQTTFEAGDRLCRWDTVPAPGPATAAVLRIALHLLKLPVAELRMELQALAEHAPSTLEPAWGSTWNLQFGSFSPVLRAEFKYAFTQPSPEPSPVEPALAALSERDRRAGIRGARPVLPRRSNYQPEHIPQHLPEDWFTVLVEASIENPLPRSLSFRRAAAVQLVQIATGTPMADAATFLQIPETWFTGHRPQVAPLTAHVLSKDFNVTDAFEAVIAHIGGAEDRIDYRERRRRFLSWRMSQETWETLAQELPGRPTTWSEKSRRACSAIIWTHLTGSEWRLAPDADPLPRNADGTRRKRYLQMKTLLAKLRNNSPNSRATQAVLADYAASLLAKVPRNSL